MLNHLFAAIVTCAHASSAVPAVPHHQVSCAALPMQAGQLDVRLPSSDETSPSSDDDKIESAPAKKIKSGKKRTKDQRRSAEEDGWGAGWKQRPSIRFGSLFRLDLDGMFQEDAHASYSGAADLDAFELRRNRIGLQGSVFKHLDFEIEREITGKEVDPSKPPKSPWNDVFVNVGFVKNAQVQVGKFKIPFGLDELTSIRNNDFVYRSLGAAYLAPARDVGAMVHGRFFRHGLNYWAGVFLHDGEHARSAKIRGGDETIAARVTGRPFRPLGLDSLEIGTAVALSSLSDDWFQPNGLRGKTVVSDDTFFHAVYVKGQRRRWETDVDWTAGPAAVRAEYTWVGDERLQQGLGDQDLPAARARSWYLSGAWVLTGGSKKRPLRPDRPLLKGGAGAVELVGRYERLWFDSVGGAGSDPAYRNPRAENILMSGDRVLTVGVNWIVNRWIKLQVNAVRERIEDAERSPVSNGAAFWSRVFRVQFAL